MALKWQQVAVGSFVSLFFILGGILNLAGISYSHDGDKTCTDCFSEIKIFSTFWVIKVGNYGDEPTLFKKVSRSRTLHINLDKIDEFVETNPKVKVELLVPAIKRTATINHPEYGYLRPLKHGDTLIYRNNVNRKAPSRIIIHGIDVVGTVKWGFELEHFLMKDINIDPKWIGTNLTESIKELKECKVIQTFKEKKDYKPCVRNQTTIFINNETGINETRIVFYDGDCLIGTHIEIINTTVCKTTGYQYKEKIWDCEKYGYVCYLDGSNLIAKAPYQSDQKVPDCPIDGSERCYVIDLKTSDTTIRGYNPTGAIKKLEVEYE